MLVCTRHVFLLKNWKIKDTYIYIYSHNYDMYIVSKRHNFAFMRKKVEFEGYSFVFESYKVTIV